MHRRYRFGLSQLFFACFLSRFCVLHHNNHHCRVAAFVFNFDNHKAITIGSFLCCNLAMAAGMCEWFQLLFERVRFTINSYVYSFSKPTPHPAVAVYIVIINYSCLLKTFLAVKTPSHTHTHAADHRRPLAARRQPSAVATGVSAEPPPRGGGYPRLESVVARQLAGPLVLAGSGASPAAHHHRVRRAEARPRLQTHGDSGFRRKFKVDFVQLRSASSRHGELNSAVRRCASNRWFVSYCWLVRRNITLMRDEITIS